MLSNLIWGFPTKKDADPDDDGKQDAEDEQQSANGVHLISDDDDEGSTHDSDGHMDEDVHQDGQKSSFNRISAHEKGKGRANTRQVCLCGLAAWSHCLLCVLNSASCFAQANGFMQGGRGFKTSQTVGDLRALAGAKDHEDQEMGAGRDSGIHGTNDSDNTNSTLARFFAEKGSTSLTAEERKRVAELLLGGTSDNRASPAHRSSGLPTMPQTPGAAFKAGADVPTALTPSFSFTAPRSLARASTTNTSVSSDTGQHNTCVTLLTNLYRACTDSVACIQALVDHGVKSRQRRRVCPLWL